MFSNTSSPFGQKPATPGSTGGFGQQPAFGTSATSAFGTPQQTTFGQTATPAFGQTSTPGFAQTTGTPAFGQGTTAPAFGQPAATPGFGQTTTTPSFGQTAATPGFGQTAPTPAFGQTSTAPAFGQATSTPGFGQAATAPAFGTPASQPAFGTPTSTPSAFGTATSSFGNTALNFGNQQQKVGFATTTQAPSLSFGTGSTTAVAQSTGFTFGTTTATTLATSSTTTQSAVNFNPPQTTTTSSLGFGLSKTPALSFGTPTTTTQGSLTFGTSLTAKPTTTSTAGFSFGTSIAASAPATTTSTGLNVAASLGLSGLSYSTSSIGGKSMLTITGNTTTPLYGVRSSDLNAGKNQGQLPPKCQPVHPAVLELVESFKNHIKDQKHLCLEVSRASLKPISKVSTDTENIKKSVTKLERAVNKNKLLNSKLREESVKAYNDVEILQKAMDYPGGFPCDSSIVTDYFLQLANKFQAQVVAMRIEIENTEKSIMCELNPSAFTPQELSTTMQRLYECFVALAGRFQFVHAQISNLKVQHLELRKKKLEDYSDIFNKKDFTMKTSEKTPFSFQRVPLADSPDFFSALRNYHSLNQMSSVGQQKSATTTLTLTPTPFAQSLLNTSLNASTLQNASLLSTPPSSVPGSKRGKR